LGFLFGLRFFLIIRAAGVVAWPRPRGGGGFARLAHPAPGPDSIRRRRRKPPPMAEIFILCPF